MAVLVAYCRERIFCRVTHPPHSYGGLSPDSRISILAIRAHKVPEKFRLADWRRVPYLYPPVPFQCCELPLRCIFLSVTSLKILWKWKSPMYVNFHLILSAWKHWSEMTALLVYEKIINTDDDWLKLSKNSQSHTLLYRAGL